jgi:hypothetical protein
VPGEVYSYNLRDGRVLADPKAASRASTTRWVRTLLTQKPKCLSIIGSIVGEWPILELTMHVVGDVVWQTLDSLHQMRSRTTFTPPPVTARALPDLDKDVSEHHATSYFSS